MMGVRNARQDTNVHLCPHPDWCASVQEAHLQEQGKKFASLVRQVCSAPIQLLKMAVQRPALWASSRSAVAVRVWPAARDGSVRIWMALATHPVLQVHTPSLEKHRARRAQLVQRAQAQIQLSSNRVPRAPTP